MKLHLLSAFVLATFLSFTHAHPTTENALQGKLAAVEAAEDTYSQTGGSDIFKQQDNEGFAAEKQQQDDNDNYNEGTDDDDLLNLLSQQVFGQQKEFPPDELNGDEDNEGKAAAVDEANVQHSQRYWKRRYYTLVRTITRYRKVLHKNARRYLSARKKLNICLASSHNLVTLVRSFVRVAARLGIRMK